jgi:hypothetical protein
MEKELNEETLDKIILRLKNVEEKLSIYFKDDFLSSYKKSNDDQKHMFFQNLETNIMILQIICKDMSAWDITRQIHDNNYPINFFSLIKIIPILKNSILPEIHKYINFLQINMKNTSGEPKILLKSDMDYKECFFITYKHHKLFLSGLF